MKNVDHFAVDLIIKSSLYGYILEAGLEYPDELHNTIIIPLLQKNLKLLIFSHYYKKIADKYNVKLGDMKNVVPHLVEKTNYTVHHIQIYLSLGTKLIKLHKILKFKLSDWMKKYIDFNTQKRKDANNEFEKSFFKLMNDSAYGKTIDNLRKESMLE